MAHKLTRDETLELHEYDSLEDCMNAVMFGTEHCPAMCSEACVTEVDGDCPHGFPSLMKGLGMI